MPANLSAVPPAAASASAADHAVGALTAAILTVAGAVAMPVLALAWVALSPLLPIALAIRGVAAGGAGPTGGRSEAHRAAA